MCGCNKKRFGGVSANRRRTISSRQIRNGVSFQSGLKTVTSQNRGETIQAQVTSESAQQQELTAQGFTNDKAKMGKITKDRREIERKRRLAIAARKNGRA